jgi:hypothetical protein
MMSLMRLIAIALLVLASAPLLRSGGAVAEPLDKESCAGLQSKRTRLLNRDMQTALDQGPDWVKTHLNEEEIERVRRFLNIEEQIEFRCRGGGVAKTKVQTGTPDEIPLPDRKPTPPSSADAKPSQTLANSDKTPPVKAKATR